MVVFQNCLCGHCEYVFMDANWESWDKLILEDPRESWIEWQMSLRREDMVAEAA